jgi:excinuclease UvrABC ATPase subunit
MELGKSIYTVSGGRVEEITVKKILGKTNADYHAIHLEEKPFFLYRPDISELVRRFHTLVVIGFGIPKELSDYAPNRV